MTLVREELHRPGGGPSPTGSAVVRLVASVTVPSAPGYAGTATILGTWRDTASPEGIVEFELVPNASVIPAGTVYEIVSQVPGRTAPPRYFTVPPSGTVWVKDNLTTFPGSLLGGPLGDYTIMVDGGSAASVFALASAVIDGGTANG